MVSIEKERRDLVRFHDLTLWTVREGEPNLFIVPTSDALASFNYE